MKYLLMLTTALLPFIGQSQRLHVDIHAAAANYQGDLQGKRFTFTNAHPALGLGLSYDITNKFIVKALATYTKLSANDKDNTTAKGVEFRNLDFRSTIYEAQLALEYNLFDLSERSFTPYVFAGIAAFHFNPYSYNTEGNKVFLRPLSTEGQGLSSYPYRKPYNLNQIAIPFGGGLKFAINDRLQLGIEIGLRKLFTDYLDDVSTSYVDSLTLLSARGPQAVAFAYRGNEIPGSPGYPADGAQRGNPKGKDWYYMTGIRISYLLFANRNDEGRKTKTGCPKSIY